MVGGHEKMSGHRGLRLPHTRAVNRSGDFGPFNRHSLTIADETRYPRRDGNKRNNNKLGLCYGVPPPTVKIPTSGVATIGRQILSTLPPQRTDVIEGSDRRLAARNAAGGISRCCERQRRVRADVRIWSESAWRSRRVSLGNGPRVRSASRWREGSGQPAQIRKVTGMARVSAGRRGARLLGRSALSDRVSGRRGADDSQRVSSLTGCDGRGATGGGHA